MAITLFSVDMYPDSIDFSQIPTVEWSRALQAISNCKVTIAEVTLAPQDPSANFDPQKSNVTQITFGITTDEKDYPQGPTGPILMGWAKSMASVIGRRVEFLFGNNISVRVSQHTDLDALWRDFEAALFITLGFLPPRDTESSWIFESMYPSRIAIGPTSRNDNPELQGRISERKSKGNAA
jgi:hypothetical protein